MTTTARISAEILTQKPQDVVHVIGLLGVTGRSSGDELTGYCPLHPDQRASFSISLITGLWYCHAENEGGNLPRLVSVMTGWSPVQVRRWLRGVHTGEPVEVSLDNEICYDEDAFFHSFIDPPDFALNHRRISLWAAADLTIRWDTTLAVGDRPYNEDEAGSDLTGWDSSVTGYGGWILPVRHPETGGLLGWQSKIPGAASGTSTTWGTRKSLALFGLECFQTGSTAILVESPLDVAYLRTVGRFGGLASFGAGVSAAQRSLLAERAGRIVLALDNDDAGRNSTAKLLKATEFRGKELFTLNYSHAPAAKDPGEMSADEIREGLRTATRYTR